MLKMISIPIRDATEAQRRSAADMLGLDIEAGETDDSIFAKILAATGNGDNIFVPADDDAPAHSQEGSKPAAPEGAEGRMEGSLGREDPKVTLMIHNEDRNGTIYSRDKEVGVNGVVWLIKRGVKATVPYRVYEALTNAVRDSVTHDPDTHTEHHTAVAAVPMQVFSMPPEDELAAWRKRTDATFCP